MPCEDAHQRRSRKDGAVNAVRPLPYARERLQTLLCHGGLSFWRFTYLPNAEGKATAGHFFRSLLACPSSKKGETPARGRGDIHGPMPMSKGIVDTPPDRRLDVPEERYTGTAADTGSRSDENERLPGLSFSERRGQPRLCAVQHSSTLAQPMPESSVGWLAVSGDHLHQRIFHP